MLRIRALQKKITNGPDETFILLRKNEKNLLFHGKLNILSVASSNYFPALQYNFP